MCGHRLAVTRPPEWAPPHEYLRHRSGPAVGVSGLEGVVEEQPIVHGRRENAPAEGPGQELVVAFVEQQRCDDDVGQIRSEQLPDIGGDEEASPSVPVPIGAPSVPGETKLTKSAYSRFSSRFGVSSPLLNASRAHALNA